MATGAKPTRMRHDADPTEIETVRIPARLNCDIRMRPFVRVPFTGPVQQPKFVIVQIEDAPTQFRGELGGARSVFGIRHFADPP